MTSASIATAPTDLLPKDATEAVSRDCSSLVLGLLSAQLWLSQSTLAVFQIAVELLIGVVLLFLLRHSRFQKREIALLFLFIASLGASAATNGLSVTLLFAKVFGLAILSILAFSRFRFDLTGAVWIIGMNVLLTMYQYIVGNPGWYLAIVQAFAETWRDFADSRPLGLFMSTHLSALLMALLFIRFGRRNLPLACIGMVCLIAAGSTSVLVAYFCWFAQRVFGFLRLDRIAIALGLLALPLLLIYSKIMLDLDLTNISSLATGRHQVSYDIIVNQLVSPDYFTRAITLLPGDPALMYNEAIGAWPNEIGFLAVLQQGGIVLGIVYLAFLFSRARGYRLFFAIAMLHFNLATYPIAILLMLQWSESTFSRHQKGGGQLFFVRRAI